MSRKRRPAEILREQPTRAEVVSGDNPEPHRTAWWIWLVGGLALLIFGFEVYGPALKGEFLFDDQYLPFLMPDVQNAPLSAWLGVRPLLMLTYWFNYQQSGLDPQAYHAVNILLHCANAALVWLITRRFLLIAGETDFRRELLAAFAGGLFLVHPALTESVAYVTSRSETLSIFFFLLAYAVFLLRRGEAISIGRTLLVLLFFGMAASVKEHTVVLPLLLLLTDYWFTTPFRFEAIRRNLTLYATIAIAGAVGLSMVWKVLSTANSAGFGLQNLPWYQYLFTQFRVIWHYLFLFVLPAGQNGDYALPVSHTLLEHGAVVGLLGLIAVSIVAFLYRRQFPLASFGWFGFLILLAPTSSVVPIQDVIVERRLYLPFLCLLLIALDFIRRWKPTSALFASTLVVVLAVSAGTAYNRNKVWSSALTFWDDVAKKSPQNARARFQLAYANWQAGNCQDAARNYEEVSKMQQPDDRLYIDWALALDCLDRTDEAVAKLQQAYKLAPSALVQAQIGMIYGKKGRSAEAMQALDLAEKIDPRFETTYVYKGNLALAKGDRAAAIALYNRALEINPRNEVAQKAFAAAQLAQPPR